MLTTYLRFQMFKFFLSKKLRKLAVFLNFDFEISQRSETFGYIYKRQFINYRPKQDRKAKNSR